MGAACRFFLPPASALENDLDYFCRFGDWRAATLPLLPTRIPPVDVVVANILPGPLERLAPLLCGLLTPGGRIFLAGLQRFRALDLISTYAQHGATLTIVNSIVDPQGNEWVLLFGHKKSEVSKCL
eukprot:GDKH01005214.1.p1 GENE.GDKH01005214.1~~GDKH01005214.1.p1  ORF type:complete len:126 (+),score=15.25 GDKH01005214.1:1-378(+)